MGMILKFAEGGDDRKDQEERFICGAAKASEV
jgi:hypothetical protein